MLPPTVTDGPACCLREAETSQNGADGARGAAERSGLGGSLASMFMHRAARARGCAATLGLLTVPHDAVVAVTPRASVAQPVRGAVHVLKVRDPLAAGGRREVIVWRPDGADTATVPVVYFLHGLPGADTDWRKDGAVQRLVGAFRAGARPFVAAFPDGNVPGGFAAAAIGLRHPRLYGQFAALAGYFHIDDPDRVFGSRAAAHDPSHLVSVARRFRILLLDGDHDTQPVVRGETQRYARLLRAHHVGVVARITRGGHSMPWAVAQLPAVARFLSSGWGRAA